MLRLSDSLTGVVSGKFRDYQASALLVGAVVRLLASGRAQAVTVIDLAMGLVFEKKTGDLVELGDVLVPRVFQSSSIFRSCAGSFASCDHLFGSTCYLYEYGYRSDF